ncbi:MAG: phenylacetate--CoA ligase [Deltaproteobacteria bacterium RIFCSPLOWO2_02_56_12]|nr:MAG: phenylacetate--CoA ligase [Deltaproteobacteria bacterium RIFCSPLOWO2_02_56_12]
MTALSRKALEEHQVKRLREMLQQVLETNEFYRKKLLKNGALKINSLEQLKELPFTTKSELVQDQLDHPPFGTDLTYPLERYIRVHQTSGTTGKPLYWFDTEADWQWWAECWKVIFEAAGVRPEDRIYFAFSFGPFIGFWSGWEGARKLGALAISGGGQSTSQRLKAIIDYRATVVVCTPTYAVHMASEARKAGIDLASDSAVRITIHAGEPGASIPSTKKLIEEAWGAKCYDHPGATEVGAYGFECEPQPGGVHVNENEFIAEVIHPETGAAVQEGERGELVITNLGRIGSPLIRYRTGDLVQPSYRPCVCGRSFMLFQGGVLGRIDDMIIVRGVNVFPSAIESVMREFAEVEEFRVEISQRGALSELKLILEPRADYGSSKGLEEKVMGRFRQSIGLRPQVEMVAPGSLPRFELKAKRFFKL